MTVADESDDPMMADGWMPPPRLRPTRRANGVGWGGPARGNVPVSSEEFMARGAAIRASGAGAKALAAYRELTPEEKLYRATAKADLTVALETRLFQVAMDPEHGRSIEAATTLHAILNGKPMARTELTGKDGAPLVPGPVIYLPSNGRDTVATIDHEDAPQEE